MHPHHPERGTRSFNLTREVWIEREDFMEEAPKGYHRLSPGNRARLKYGYVIECTGCEKDADGRITAVLATSPDTKSGTPGADSVKVKGVITWVSVAEGLATEVRLYDRLSTEAHPDAGGRDFLTVMNPDSVRSARPSSNPAWRPQSRTTSSSSSATVASWPTGWTRSPAGRCSTGRSR